MILSQCQSRLYNYSEVEQVRQQLVSITFCYANKSLSLEELGW